MKSLIQAVAVAAALIVPVASFAQQAPVTRAQVRAELVQLQQVGYHVGDGDQAHYPAAIQAAEAKVAARNGNSAYGGVANASESGVRGATVSQQDWNAMYTR
ncbi:uncharacterized protein DUF4148 [Paraburkholderia eburnea]|uniref:Uncharacterized protein DUF4148 n=1 Tax=Paraburkholderia eburnea TaxID=1189126 RepID=A0A2S4MLS9_9BURK|nr:DUF4148 domain-containing protein [Paraburkholderia eburnea]POR55700.1 uncharacterized protein DUF4148 [Paraburkholderia eburnea]PRZ26828.1 uncharacterized protein DUF4148 [Paraburkholderia eburnea]